MERFRETLRYKFFRFLILKGVYSVSARVRLASSRLRFNPFQEIALRMAVWGGRLDDTDAYGGLLRFEEECCGRLFQYYGWGRLNPVDAAYVEDGFCREFLELLGEPKPIFIIDLSLLLDHVSESEYLSLRSQVSATLGVLRQYLWDQHLALTSSKPGVGLWFKLLLGRARVTITGLSSRDFLASLNIRRPILLDPYAERDLDGRDVMEADAFIVGGVVDKVPRPGATKAIGRLIEEAKPRRIALRGSLIGVPNRINSIVEIVLRARYETCGNVEKAITTVMSPRDIRMRAYVEISREARGRGYVNWSLYCRLREWLPLTREDFLKAARMAHVEVRGRLEECETVSKDQSRHRCAQR